MAEQIPTIIRPFFKLGKRIPSFFSNPEEFFNQPWPEFFSSESTGLSIYEDEKTVTVEAAVPGLNANEIEVHLDNGILWIKGERKAEQEDKKRKYYQRSSSVFSYSVSLPREIDQHQEPAATYKDGIMKIQFQKSKKGTAKKISVKKG